MYEYLNKIPLLNKDGYIDTSCSNSFSPVNIEEIIKAEKDLGYQFPSELRQFYQEIGYGCLTTPKDPPQDYDFCNKNMILHPLVVSGFRQGITANHEFECYMMDDVYEDLESGDLPVFEIGDSSSFMIMKPLSDNPNAVWYMGSEKIEDSFERFIYRLYHESPTYYADNW